MVRATVAQYASVCTSLCTEKMRIKTLSQILYLLIISRFSSDFLVDVGRIMDVTQHGILQLAVYLIAGLTG